MLQQTPEQIIGDCRVLPQATEAGPVQLVDVQNFLPQIGDGDRPY